MLKQTAADANQLEDTFQQWEQNAERAISGLRLKGVTIRKVPIDIHEFKEWCRHRGLPQNGESRSSYVIEMLSGKLGDG